jgi:hypothetical protein
VPISRREEEPDNTMDRVIKRIKGIFEEVTAEWADEHPIAIVPSNLLPPSCFSRAISIRNRWNQGPPCMLQPLGRRGDYIFILGEETSNNLVCK